MFETNLLPYLFHEGWSSLHLQKCMSFQIMGDSNIPDAWRQLALEAIVTLSETAPAMVRKHGKFLGIMGKSAVNIIPREGCLSICLLFSYKS
jgi:hypothetical protein